ncbi:MAG: hypothetical protein D8M58_17770 [Calditrichaeota bacterium]|nr:MAG: hypothetical protein DWQ03_01685 [Calditrichota bacterium]MBL1207256.1 hypothetical protein [Calditrichota bacterium]
MTHLSKKYLPFITFFLLCFIWSSTWVAIKIGLVSLPPFLSAGLRFILAFLFLSVFAITKKIEFPKSLKTHLFLFVFGMILFTGGYSFVYWGQQHISSGLASVLFSVFPFYVLLFSAWLLPKEKISLKKATGVFVGFVGIVIIFWDKIEFEDSSKFAIWGMVAFLIGPIFSSLGTILAKKASNTINPITLNTLPMLYTSISFLIISYFYESDLQPVFDAYAIFSILYLALFGTAIAFVLYFWMLKNTSPVLMSMITYVTPPLALIWGWVIFDETISPILILGLLIIFFGIGILKR